MQSFLSRKCKYPLCQFMPRKVRNFVKQIDKLEIWFTNLCPQGWLKWWRLKTYLQGFLGLTHVVAPSHSTTNSGLNGISLSTHICIFLLIGFLFKLKKDLNKMLLSLFLIKRSECFDLAETWKKYYHKLGGIKQQSGVLIAKILMYIGWKK